MHSGRFKLYSNDDLPIHIVQFSQLEHLLSASSALQYVQFSQLEHLLSASLALQ